MAVPVVWHPSYEVDIGPHVFPTRKYRLVRERLLADGTVASGDFIEAQPATDQQVGLVHDADYVRKITTGTLSVPEQQVLEVPFSPALREAAWLCAGGSTLTARLAMERGVAVHLGGGFHHAFPDHGEGFCLINDVAIAIRVLAREGIAGRAAVIDLDVHHGNGTAAIFRDDPTVFTFSMHQENNYPFVKPPSDLDVGLADGTGDDAYLRLLDRHLSELLSRHRPELVFYLAGADPYRFDQLGGLGLTLAGLKRRDEVVFERALATGAGVAVCLAGGYAVRTDDTVEIHCNTVRAAADAAKRAGVTPRGARRA
ncbi:MAG TPA: histone deacetylase [Gemmatimonadales bacterium]|nr:histone deacetylase [Gemmatimonadales bacterium]